MRLEDLDPAVRRVVDRVTTRLLEQGAKAVLLTGSHARGHAEPESDIDFFAIGDGPAQRQQIVEGQLVAVHWFTPEAVRRRLTSPADALIAVDGWRNAVVLEDPIGIADELCAEARDWSWEKIGREADAWVCDELAELAEYVAKLVRALTGDRLLDAAALRAEVALRLGRVGAVAFRVTVRSENGFWDTLASADGSAWREALTAALDPDGERLDAAVRGVLDLFDLLVERVVDLLDDDQRAVIDRVREIASPRPVRSQP